MKNRYKKVSIDFMIPDNSEPETVIRNLGSLYRLDRKSDPVGEDNLLFIVEEVDQEREEEEKDNEFDLPPSLRKGK